MNANFTFINLPTHSTQRDRELARSRANSHVARFGHRRRGLNYQPYTSTESRSSSGGRSSTSRSFSESLITSVLEPQISERATSHGGECNPWHIVNNGNSDPFGCMPIPITPAVNRIIVFFHSRLLNCFADGKPRLSSPRVIYRMASQGLIYDTNIDGLQDECSSRSFLVFIGALRARYTQREDAYQELQTLQVKSQTVLRSRIQTTGRWDHAILFSVVAHFGASVMLQNYEQAIGHGQFLRALLLARVKNNISVPLGLLKQAIWVDTHLAIARFQPSILEGEKWIPQLLEPIERQIAVCLSELPAETTTSLDPIISSEPLRSAFIRLRQSVALAVSPSQHFVDQGISCVLFVVLHVCIARLNILNHCINAQIKMHRVTSSIDKTRDLHHRLEAMVSVATMYLLDRSSMYTCCFSRYTQQSDILMSMLQFRTSDTLQCIAQLGDEAKGYQSACIFALFVKTQGQRWTATRDETLFNRESELEFATTAREMGLRSWNDVKNACNGFFLSTVVEPKGEDWVDELLNRSRSED